MQFLKGGVQTVTALTHLNWRISEYHSNALQNSTTNSVL